MHDKKSKKAVAGYAKAKNQTKNGDGEVAVQTMQDKQSAVDTVVIRYRDKADGTQVLTGSRFLMLADNRSGGKGSMWHKVECVQACVKGKQMNGMGELISYEFYAPIDLGALQHASKEEKEKDIDFSYKHLPSDIDLLKHEKDELFCYRQCLKMAYYMQIVRNVELLRMSAEFYKDELGFIWFFYAQDIYTRPV